MLSGFFRIDLLFPLKSFRNDQISKSHYDPNNFSVFKNFYSEKGVFLSGDWKAKAKSFLNSH
jgi:hypothetical protein